MEQLSLYATTVKPELSGPGVMTTEDQVPSSPCSEAASEQPKHEPDSQRSWLLSETPCTAAPQAPLSMGFSRPEC